MILLLLLLCLIQPLTYPCSVMMFWFISRKTGYLRSPPTTITAMLGTYRQPTIRAYSERGCEDCYHYGYSGYVIMVVVVTKWGTCVYVFFPRTGGGGGGQ